MELTVGPADFGVPAARTSVGTIPPGGRLACGAWRLVTWRPLHGRPLRGDRDLGLFGRCRPTHGSPRNGRRTGRGRAEGVGNSLASGVVPEPGRYARAEGRHLGVVVGIDGVGRRDRFLNWGFESASLFGASRALPYLGRRDRFRIWGVEIASLRQRQMTWQGAPDGTAGRATPQGTGDGASFQIWVGSRGRSEKIATRDWPTLDRAKGETPAHVTCDLPAGHAAGRGPRP